MKTNTLLRRAALAVLAAPVILLCACSKQELYSQLSERQANEMVAVLRGAGIDAEKQINDGQFSVATSTSDFAQAVRTLSAQGYPRETFDSMGKVFKREGFVSSPLEERARLLHAMSQEIANTLANIDGVVTARVHLSLPEKNPLADKVPPASAAVFIKHRPDTDLRNQITQIKALVVNSIEGLAYDNVTVALFPAESLPVQSGKATLAAPATPVASTGPRNAMATPLLAGTAAGALALFGGGLLWWRRRAPALDEEAGAAAEFAAGSPTPRGRLPEGSQVSLDRPAGRK